MKTKEALTVLTSYQEWRRGQDRLQINPFDVGRAIDVALVALRKEVDNCDTNGCVGCMRDLKKAAAALGKKGGLKRGPTKARTPEQARKAGLASAAARKEAKTK